MIRTIFTIKPSHKPAQIILIKGSESTLRADNNFQMKEIYKKTTTVKRNGRTSSRRGQNSHSHPLKSIIMIIRNDGKRQSVSQLVGQSVSDTASVSGDYVQGENTFDQFTIGSRGLLNRPALKTALELTFSICKTHHMSVCPLNRIFRASPKVTCVIISLV